MQVNLSFDNSLRTWMGVAAAGSVLVAAVLATVMINVGWASTGFQGMEATYTLTEVDFGAASAAYGEFDEGDGRGLITASYILGIVALALGFLAVPILMAGTLMQGGVLRVVGAAVTGLAAVALVLTTVLGPVGISGFHGDALGADGGELSWGAGLVLGVIAAVLALAATVAALLSLRSAPAEA